MKTLTNYLGTINEDSAEKKELLNQYETIQKKVEKELKKVDLGVFEVSSINSISSIVRLTFKPSPNRMSWGFGYDSSSKSFLYQPVSGSGAFDNKEDDMEYYKSIGLILSQDEFLTKNVFPLCKELYDLDTQMWQLK